MILAALNLQVHSLDGIGSFREGMLSKYGDLSTGMVVLTQLQMNWLNLVIQNVVYIMKTYLTLTKEKIKCIYLTSHNIFPYWMMT